jgi:hypothetical protein
MNYIYSLSAVLSTAQGSPVCFRLCRGHFRFNADAETREIANDAIKVPVQFVLQENRALLLQVGKQVPGPAQQAPT